MLKVLAGQQYSQYRLAGVLHECFCAYIGATQDIINVTIYLDGVVKQNTITQAYGAMIDTESLTYLYLPDIHKERLVSVVSGDGWNDMITA